MTVHICPVKDIECGGHKVGWCAGCPKHGPKAADRIEALTAENARLRTVMVAAAEEIQAHWDAHCDAEGYGPANLMRRLEEGIPSQYGYTAGRFAELEAERDRLREELERWRARYEEMSKCD